MKKLLSFMVTIAIIATIALLPVEGYSEPKWRLYDDFNSGNLNRWIVSPETPDGIITNENGEAKFHFAEETPPGRYFLLINKKPQQLEKIKGIRVTVRVAGEEEHVGDILGGIGAMIGKWAGFYVFDEFYIKAGFQTIICGLHTLYFVGEQAYRAFNLFYGEFGEFPPDYIINKNFTITMIFSENEMTYEVSGHGTIIRTQTNMLDPSDYRHFRGLVTVSGDGLGTADVYFDDVYILQ